MLKMLANPRMMLLLPMMFFTGLNNTFYAAWFTRQILSCHTGLVLLALGAGEMVGAYMAGACPPCSKPRAARLMCPPPRKNRRHGEEWPENRSVLRDCDAGCRALPLRLCQQQRRLHQFLCACRSSSSPPSAPPTASQHPAALLGLADACFQPQVHRRLSRRTSLLTRDTPPGHELHRHRVHC